MPLTITLTFDDPSVASIEAYLANQMIDVTPEEWVKAQLKPILTPALTAQSPSDVTAIESQIQTLRQQAETKRFAGLAVTVKGGKPPKGAG